MSALDWMLQQFPEVKEREGMRRIIGRYGLTGKQQVSGNFKSTLPAVDQFWAIVIEAWFNAVHIPIKASHCGP